jgi:hypothetical protein
MSKFNISHMARGNVWALYRMRSVINANPDYQRHGDVWNLEQKQLLIDTIINRFDVPKVYLHRYTRSQEIDGKLYEYSIIDGKQRLTTIWDFIEGKFSLAADFEYFADKSIQLGGLTYKDFSSKYPDLKSDFDAYLLIVVEVETDDVEMIEEMFSRLNEAAPLNAPEKRNAYGGPIPKSVRDLCNMDFFVDKIPFSNSRYRHFDLATKFLYAVEANKIVDTKKIFLDKFVEKYSKASREEDLNFVISTKTIVQEMSKVFIDKDPLLRSTGMVMLYFYLFKTATEHGWLNEIVRAKLDDFEKQRGNNRDLAKTNLAKADYDLIQFDKYTQSPNDKNALEFRLKILLETIFDKNINLPV